MILNRKTTIFEIMQNSMTTAHQGFLFTSATWKEVPDLICQEIPAIGAQLNQKIHFQDFGDGVDSILYIAVMVPPSHDDHRNGCRYNSKKKQIKIVQQLEYDLVVNSSKEEFKTYFIETMMRLLRQLNVRKPIQNFNLLALTEAIERTLKVRVEQ